MPLNSVCKTFHWSMESFVRIISHLELGDSNSTLNIISRFELSIKMYS